MIMFSDTNYPNILITENFLPLRDKLSVIHGIFLYYQRCWDCQSYRVLQILQNMFVIIKCPDYFFLIQTPLYQAYSSEKTLFIMKQDFYGKNAVGI